MRKRNILESVPEPVENTEVEPKQEVKEIEESRVFGKPKKTESLEIKDMAGGPSNDEPVIQEEQPVEPVKTKKAPYSHLAEARAKSLETRRKRAQEKKAIDQAAQEYKEKLIYEKLKAKYEKKLEKEREKEEKKRESKKALHSQPVQTPTEPEEPILRQPSVVNDSTSTIDYDKLVSMMSEKMAPSQSYLRDLEDRIRKDERSKHESEMVKWQHDQHRRQQREQSLGIMSPRSSNPVFQRSNQIRGSYSRYNPNWMNM
jgi:glutamate synthase domain-containing protein 2